MSGSDRSDELAEFADFIGTPPTGITPLMLAASDDDCSVQRVLAEIAAGADVNARDSNGMTALHHAVRCYYKQSIVSTLVRNGADATIRDRWNNTIVHAAFIDGACGGRLQTIRRFIHTVRRAGLSLTEPDRDGDTPLAFQVHFGGVDEVRALLEAGVDPNSMVRHVVWLDRDTNAVAFWPAVCAAVDSSVRPVEMVRVLAEFGADLRVKTPDGRSLRTLAYLRWRQARRWLAEARARYTPYRFESTQLPENEIAMVRELARILPR